MVVFSFIWFGLSFGEMDVKLVGVEVCFLYCSYNNVLENKSSYVCLKN